MRNLVYCFCVLVLGAGLYFYGIGNHGLLEPDEGRFAEISREMNETGDYNTPRLNYVKFFAKPALPYWMNALSFKMWGENEFAARFPTALMAFLSGVLVFILARSIYGERAGYFSAAILLTMLLHLVIGQLNIADMTVSFFLTMSLVGFWLGAKKYWVFYLGMALALLSKGLIGVVLPGAIVFWYIVLSRQWDIFKKMLFDWRGLALFFIVSVPWFVTVCLANGDFFYLFFIREHFLRFTTSIHGNYEPVWFFVPFLILGLLPWTGFLPRVIREFFDFKALLKEENRPRLFLALWFLIIFVFFSLSSSKLIPYIVPLLPPLAVMFGKFLLDIEESQNFESAKRFMVWSVPLLALIAIASVAYPFINDHNIGVFGLLKYTLPLGIVSVLFLAVGFYFLRVENMKFFVSSLLILALIFSGTAKRGFALMGETRSARATANLIAEHKKEGDEIAQIWDYERGLPFYLKQRIILIDSHGERSFGAEEETVPKWFLTSDKLPELIKAKRQGKLFLVNGKKSEERLKDLLASSDITLPEPLGRDSRNVVYVF